MSVESVPSPEKTIEELQSEITKSMEQRVDSLKEARALLEEDPHPAASLLGDAIEEVTRIQNFIISEFHNVENALQYLAEQASKQELLLTGTLNHLESTRIVNKIGIHKAVGELIKERQAADTPPVEDELGSVD